ncbi:16S rRNA (cytosine(1402)-N(4))-methyltransferase [bacterium CG10_46_32]|nr:MAG: 16S rRNA (cytosine(1402)-N(4))-methyltransferase [bacterium CG10_46_32]PIR55662.1 MAG: 16S rRNA (cytosine(1402)-N(4))-methyltransferase [Parcubacteria group bacterium CG10_big_fil_rev_8_21_14_0_10_46_32]
MDESLQIPVMLEEVISGLNLTPGALVIDATIGGGGHAEAILTATAPQGKLLGLDWDKDAITRSGNRLAAYQDRVVLKQANYTETKTIAYEQRFYPVSALLLDLGLSRDQLKDGARGFAIQTEGPLDMRFSDQVSLTAKEIVNTWPEKSLEQIFTEFGEERHAARAAQAIAAARKLAPINTTRELADVVVRGVGRRGRYHIHPATRIFQALRIATNREFENIKQALPEMVSLLAPGGRIAVLTFHSLEDRIVKFFFRDLARAEHPTIALVNKKVIKPGRPEVLGNKASRSAKLRIIEKL